MSEWLVHHELERGAHWRPDDLAVSFEGTEYTYRAFDRRVNRVARALRDGGVTPGETVLVHGHNHGDLYTLFFACSKLGAVYSPVSTFQSERNVEYICDTLAPSHVFYTADEDVCSETLPPIRASTDAAVVSLDADTDRDDDATIEGLIEGRSGEKPDWADDHSRDDRHNVFWTSGTTGRPKAVVRDHPASLRFADPLADAMGFSPEDRRLVQNNMMFAAPYLQYGLPTFGAGGANFVLREFSPEGVYRAVEEHDINIGIIGFTQTKVLSEYLESNGLSMTIDRIHGVVPSANLASTLYEMAEELYHIYATTEVGLPLATRLEPPFDDTPPLGRPGRSADVRLVPPGENRALLDDQPAPGDRGEIAVQGDVTMARYLTDENQREKVVDGWIFPGDVLRVDDNGELVFVSRVDDRLRSGGINVYPAEVETVLEAHPDVEDSVVVGIDDERWGDRITALVVTAIDDTDALADELDAFCRESDQLVGELRPRTYAFVHSSDDVPTGALNKVDRGAVVDRFFS